MVVNKIFSVQVVTYFSLTIYTIMLTFYLQGTSQSLFHDLTYRFFFPAIICSLRTVRGIRMTVHPLIFSHFKECQR
jgi:hypothetical protein